MKEIIAHNIAQLYGHIAEICEEHDRDTDDIIVVAVTKSQPTNMIKMAVAAGLHNIGESRVQEAADKIAELGQIARFHMVGHLQMNKVKKAIQLFDVIQSVDSLKLAEEINRQAGMAELDIECLIEVNCSGESQKFGVAPEDCLDIVKQVSKMSQLDLAGLMTIGPNTEDDEAVRKSFRLCHDLFQRGRDLLGDRFDTLSMGMSGDYPLAIEEGSTMIRIGTALFGKRS